MNEVTKKLVMDYIHQFQLGNFLPALEWLEEKHDFQAAVYGGERNRDGERKILDVISIMVQNVKAIENRMMSIRKGVTLLYGPNDSGKTTMRDALVFALSKRTYAGSSAPEDLIRRGCERATVIVTMNCDDDPVPDTITRSVETKLLKKGKKVGSVETIYALSGTLGGVPTKGNADAEANLSGYLGQPFDTLHRCFLVGQGQLDALLDEQPGKRQELFFKMLALEPCEVTRAKISAILKDAEQVLGNELSHAMACKLEIAQEKKKLEELGDVHAARNRLMVLQNAVDKRRAYDAKADSAIITKQAQRDRLELLSKNYDFCDGLNTKRYQLLKEKEVLPVGIPEVAPSLVQNWKELGQLHSDLVARREFIREQGTLLKTLPPVCTVCELMGKMCELTPELREQKRQQLLERYHKVDADVAAAWASYEVVGKQFAAAQELVQIHKATEARHAEIARAVAEIDSELARIGVTKEVVQAAQAEYNQVQNIAIPPELEDDENTFGEARLLEQKINEANRLADNIEERKEKLKAHEAASGDEAQRWLTTIRLVETAFKKEGIPLWIARQHLDEINGYALEMCGEDRYRYAFNEDLAIEVWDMRDSDKGAYDPKVHPGMASGSSRQRAALALQAARARWQCRMNGVQPQLFWIDELPFQNAEQHGDLCVGLIKRLTKWFPKVVFAASNWAPYAGKFDHEIALLGDPIKPDIRPKTAELPPPISETPAKPPALPPVDQGEIEADVERSAKPTRKRRTKAEMEAAKIVSMPAPAPEVTLCSVCRLVQTQTPSGMVCANGHGGAPPSPSRSQPFAAAAGEGPAENDPF